MHVAVNSGCGSPGDKDDWNVCPWLGLGLELGLMTRFLKIDRRFSSISARVFAVASLTPTGDKDSWFFDDE